METRLKEVLAIVNHKGGVGKTTTVQSLAAAIVRRHKDYRVLVIDADPQCHLSILAGWNPKDNYSTTPTIFTAMQRGTSLPVYRTKREGVFLVPGDDKMQSVDPYLYRQNDTMQSVDPYLYRQNDTMQSVDPDLDQQEKHRRVLQKCFGLPIDDHTDKVCPTGEVVQPSVVTWPKCEKEGMTDIFSSFDYVLIDCPPALSETTFNAMTVATGILVPVQLAGLSVNGLGKIIVAMRETQSKRNPKLELRGLLPTMVDARPNIVRGFIDYLRRSYGDNVCDTMIHRAIKMDEAQTKGKDIFQYKQWSNVANDYDALEKELFN